MYPLVFLMKQLRKGSVVHFAMLGRRFLPENLRTSVPGLPLQFGDIAQRRDFALKELMERLLADSSG